MSSSDTLILQKQQTLTALAEARNSSLKQYLESIREDLLITAVNSNVQDAMPRFSDGFRDERSLRNDPLASLQAVYINETGLTPTSTSGNKEALGEKHLFNGPTNIDGAYHTQHQRFHPWFRQMLEGRGYYDIFLINPEGDVVYTVFKELDYATNLLNGKYNTSGLAQVFKATLSNKDSGSISFVDFAPYAPSNDAPASFIATPIITANGFEGVLVFQMPIDRIDHILQLSAGMGESGETYLVGSDFLMRSDSRFSEESTILKTEVNTATVHKALNGNTGIEVTPDYRGIPVLSAFQPFEFEGTRWALMAEIDEAEMLAPAHEARLFILMIGGIVLFIVAVIGWLFARSIIRPLQKSTSEMLLLAEGDKSFEVSGLERRDEIRDIASALQTFKDNAIEQDRSAAENMRIKSALDSSSANVMVADNNFDIIYMNDAVLEMMREGEADIRKDLPGFDTNKLLGDSIDRFHKNPAHQRSMLGALTTTYQGRIEVGGRSYDLVANPITNESQERLGTVVEWADVTAELAIEVEVDEMVQAISSGDFTKSLEAEGKEGFMLALTNALNSLNKNVSDVVDDVATALSSLSRGDLTHQITTSYTGTYETLKQDVNQTSKRLAETVGDIVATTDEIGSASTEIASGSMDLSQRTEAQASSLQQTAASMEEMSTTVKQNADSAQQANQMALNATETAE
ncbi:methyl-accepting chemotaxis protein, partial [Kiloniella sp. EL199]|uniref:methyl-accepting chemotaxis protein n=1 Tax=Kiloniella sp. EL199 TaxID=2107581 RepID=UPI001C1FBF12